MRQAQAGAFPTNVGTGLAQKNAPNKGIQSAAGAVLYRHLPRLFDAHARSRRWPSHAPAEGHCAQRTARPRRLEARRRLGGAGRDLLEILADRQGRGSSIVTSQVDVKHWHEMLATRPGSVAVPLRWRRERI